MKGSHAPSCVWGHILFGVLWCHMYMPTMPYMLVKLWGLAALPTSSYKESTYIVTCLEIHSCMGLVSHMFVVPYMFITLHIPATLYMSFTLHVPTIPYMPILLHMSIVPCGLLCCYFIYDIFSPLNSLTFSLDGLWRTWQVSFQTIKCLSCGVMLLLHVGLLPIIWGHLCVCTSCGGSLR